MHSAAKTKWNLFALKNDPLFRIHVDIALYAC